MSRASRSSSAKVSTTASCSIGLSMASWRRPAARTAPAPAAPAKSPNPSLTRKNMCTSLFDFDLPTDRMALRPASPRDAARMLVVRPGDAPELDDKGVRDLPNLLRDGDALVVNDTKVISARLSGRRIGRATEPKIEATLVKRLDGSRWRAFV